MSPLSFCTFLITIIIFNPPVAYSGICQVLPPLTRRTKGDSIKETYTPSLLDCQDTCLLHPRCAFFEYQPSSKACRLIRKVSKEENIQVQHGDKVYLIERPKRNLSACPNCSSNCELSSEMTRICQKNQRNRTDRHHRLNGNASRREDTTIQKNKSKWNPQCIKKWEEILMITCDITPDIIITMATNITKGGNEKQEIAIHADEDILLGLRYSTYRRGQKQSISLVSKIDEVWKATIQKSLTGENRLGSEVWPLEVRICPKLFQVVINKSVSMTYHRYSPRLPNAIYTLKNVVGVNFHTTTLPCEEPWTEKAPLSVMDIFG